MNRSRYLLICLHYWFNIISENTQASQSNDDSIIYDMLIRVSQKFEENKGQCLGNDDKNNKTNEIPYKKQNQRMAVQLMSRFFLHYKNLKETKDGICDPICQNLT